MNKVGDAGALPMAFLGTEPELALQLGPGSRNRGELVISLKQ